MTTEEQLKKLTSLMESILPSIKEFNEMVPQLQGMKQILEETLRNQVRDHLLELGAYEQDYAFELALERVSMGTSSDLKSIVDKAKEDYERSYGRIHGADSPYMNSLQNFESYIAQKQAEMQKQQADSEELKKQMM